MARITFNVDIHAEDDGSYWASVEELPGCFASGFSLDELKEALAEAMQMWLPDGIELEHLKWGPLDSRPVSSRKGEQGKKPSSKMLVCA